MKYSSEQVKTDIILVIAVMTLLFTICLVLYSDVFNRDAKMDITTSINFNGGNDTLSQRLQSLIPYSDTIDTKYLTAYQEKTTYVSNIQNDVLLQMAYKKIDYKDSFNNNDVIQMINKYYGINIFISHNSFNVDGSNSCVYDSKTKIYNCKSGNYNGIIYKADRKIDNITTNEDSAYLDENVLFYSVKIINKITYYDVYKDSLYTDKIATFTSVDLKNDDLTYDQYLDNYINYRNKYKSIFKKVNDDYIWIETVKI